MKQGDCGGFAVRDAGTAGEPRSSSAGREDGLRQAAQSSFRKMRFDGSLLQRRAVQRRRKKNKTLPIAGGLEVGIAGKLVLGQHSPAAFPCSGKAFLRLYWMENFRECPRRSTCEKVSVEERLYVGREGEVAEN